MTIDELKQKCRERSAEALWLVIEAAQIGAITAEQARELLETPGPDEVPVQTPCGPITLRSDPSLGPDEMRIENAPPSAVATPPLHLDRLDRLIARTDELIAQQQRALDRLIARTDELIAQQQRALDLMLNPMVYVSEAPRSGKMEAIAQLNEDLAAGRVKLPAHEWRREYLGEWFDPGTDPVPDSRRRSALKHGKPDPLDVDVEYDAISLRVLLECDERARREDGKNWRFGSQRTWTTDQRAAVSAYWSAELRARVAASAERDRNHVRIDLQDEP